MRAFPDRWLRCVCVPAVAGASGGGVCRACAARPYAAGCSLPSRPGSALRCPGPTPPARSRRRLPTLPGPAAGGWRPSARPRRRPGSGRGRQWTPMRGSRRAWSRPGPKEPAPAATGPCYYREPSRHCRPGGGSTQSSRAAATRTLPPGGARAPVLRSGAGGGRKARASNGQAERRVSSPRRRPPSWKKSWPGRAYSPSPDRTARPFSNYHN